MLIRQRIILGLLTRIAGPVKRTTLVMLVFLLRHATSLRRFPSFYDFVPHTNGPFSFTLYRDLEILHRDGHITLGETACLTRGTPDPNRPAIGSLSASAISSVVDIVSRYGDISQRVLIETVYRRHAWYALNSELPQRDLVAPQRPDAAIPAIYTAGYAGRSLEAFFNDLLSRGVAELIDVRANPVSRKYGFSKSKLAKFSDQLGLTYLPRPSGFPATSDSCAGMRSC